MGPAAAGAILKLNNIRYLHHGSKAEVFSVAAAAQLLVANSSLSPPSIFITTPNHTPRFPRVCVVVFAPVLAD